MLIFIGAPVFYLELTLGQFTSAGPLVVWNVNPLLRGSFSIIKRIFLVQLCKKILLLIDLKKFENVPTEFKFHKFS